MPDDLAPPPPGEPGAPPLRVVGIGASAGGLEALHSFLAQVPAHSGMAYAVVQHLDPTHKAMLAPLLQRVTTMPVQEAAPQQRVEADHVYVIAPNTSMRLARGMLRLSAPTQPHGLRRPIDALFESLADELAQDAVGVLLSGMGSDGTAGLRAIKAKHGLTLAQAPASAQFDAMPSSAIAAGCVDIVCEAGDMAQQIQQALSRRAAHAPAAQPVGTTAALRTPARAAPSADAGPHTGLDQILDLLRQAGKHDFRLYKRSTLQRRTERRMGIHRLTAMGDYARLLRDNPQELDLLFKELLIGVTALFRDRQVWQALQGKALPALLARQADGAHLRAWVAGCSTGEEAYSLAMAFREVADASPDRQHCSLQIFATDLSVDAIAQARRGFFPASVARDLPQARLSRFFTQHEGGYRIASVIREAIVFAPHDLTVDPPFTKLDLLSCRNLLIYLTAPLQRRLLPLFHYSLKPGGVLMLGTSETVGHFEHLFAPLDLPQRLYLRVEGPSLPTLPEFPLRPHTRPPTPPTPEDMPVDDHPSPNPSFQAAANQLLLQALAPPALLVDPHGDIVYINGRTGKYLEPAAGKANWNIHAMAREGLRQPLLEALSQANGEDSAAAPVVLHGLAVDGSRGAPRVDVSIQALNEPGPLKGMRLIAFRELPPNRGRRPPGAASAPSDLVANLQRERDAAQSLREEMRASQEELQAANEELQSTNEELQSTNEELTSSKEEMQSMNEELQAVNAELQSKLDDLALAQSDMRNLLNSTDIATLFLDKELNVRRFTERSRKIFSLRDTDLGRPLSDLTTRLEYPSLGDDVKDMLRTMVISEREIHSQDGQWYAVRVMPYRTQDDVIKGAVITFVDITAAKALEAKLRSTGAD